MGASASTLSLLSLSSNDIADFVASVGMFYTITSSIVTIIIYI
jgi:hypothetical protein